MNGGNPATPKSSLNSGLAEKRVTPAATPSQAVLDLGVEVQRDVNGVEMGVLENGIPFLTQRGLVKLTGAPRSSIYDLTQEWEARFDDIILRKDRHSFIRERLAKNGYNERRLYIETKKDGSTQFAYPDVVCMAILEFYAFEAKSPPKEAIDSYRSLAVFGLQRFIYESLHYIQLDKWKHHHERVSLLQNAAPDGYWIVFSEVTCLIVDLITANLAVNRKPSRTLASGKRGHCIGKSFAYLKSMVFALDASTTIRWIFHRQPAIPNLHGLTLIRLCLSFAVGLGTRI